MVSDVRDHIAQALIQATKAQKKCRLNTLRLISAAIKDRDMAARDMGKENISDSEIFNLLSKMICQREESLKAYEETGRLDLVEQELEEIKVIQSLLPPQLGDDEVRQLCQTVVKDLSATGLRDMGKCVNALKSKYPGKMDFCYASRVVKELLQ